MDRKRSFTAVISASHTFRPKWWSSIFRPGPIHDFPFGLRYLGIDGWRFLTPLLGPLPANSTRPVSIGSRYLSRCVRAATSFTVSCPCPNLSVGVPKPETRGGVSPLPPPPWMWQYLSRPTTEARVIGADARYLPYSPVRCRLFAEALFPPVSVSCANTAAPLIHHWIRTFGYQDNAIFRYTFNFWLRPYLISASPFVRFCGIT